MQTDINHREFSNTVEEPGAALSPKHRLFAEAYARAVLKIGLLYL